MFRGSPPPEILSPLRPAAIPAAPGTAAGAPPRKALRVVLRQDYPQGKPQDVGNFAAAAQEEIATVLGVPPETLQVLYVFGDGTGNVAIDISMVGRLWGQEAVAAAQLAAFISRGGNTTIPMLGKKSAMLVGAEVQLLLGTPWEEVPQAPSSPLKRPGMASPRMSPKREFEWSGHQLRPQLGLEVEQLLEEGGRLMRDRPHRSARLKMLEERQRQRIAVRKLEERFWARKQRRLNEAAIFIQRMYRSHRMHRIANRMRREKAAIKIQAAWRGYRLRVRVWTIKDRLDKIAKIQAWWRGNLARWKLYGMLNAIQMWWRCVLAKIMALELRTWFQDRRRKVIKIQAHYRRYLAQKELKRLRIVKRERYKLAVWVQSLFGAHLEVKRLLEERRAAVVIQSSWRKYVTRVWARQLYKELGFKGSAHSAQQMITAVAGPRKHMPITQAQIAQERLEADERRRRLKEQRKAEAEQLKNVMYHAHDHAADLARGRDKLVQQEDTAARTIQRMFRIRKQFKRRAGDARIHNLHARIGTKNVEKLPLDLLEGIRYGALEETGWTMEEFSEYDDEEEAVSLQCWDRRLCSNWVDLSHDYMSAKHKDRSRRNMQGVVFGNGPLAKLKGGKYYFEVRIDKLQDDVKEPDGLTLGITTKQPWLEQKIYQIGNEVPNSWSIGYDGMAHSPSGEVDIHFKPADLKVNDTVGLLITKDREVYVVVNGEVRGDSKTDGEGPPKKTALWPFIDLLGNAMGATLLANAQPPEFKEEAKEEEAAGWFGGYFGGGESGEKTKQDAESDDEQPGKQKESAGEERMRFDAGLAGRYVKVSDDGLKAISKDTNRTELFGVVFGKRSLKPHGNGLYFEVRIEQVVLGCHDGLVIGVCKEKPKKPPATADALEDAWSLGYDGKAKVPGQRLEAIGWHPTELRVGDRVGLHVNTFGEIWVLQNDVPIDRCPGIVPLDVKLYPFVDLLGNAVGVSLVQGVLPPAPTLLSVFEKKLLSPYVKLAEGGLVATSWDPTGKEPNGVVYGDAPIPKFDKGVYFEVQVEKTRSFPELLDGLTLGVTTALPKPSDPLAAAADDVPNSWSIGFDGQAKINGLEDMIAVQFNPTTIKVGDKAGFLVTPEAELIYFVNEKPVVRLHASIPAGAPLFPIVDLLGTCAAVRLLPDAQPPASFGARVVQKAPPPREASPTASPLGTPPRQNSKEASPIPSPGGSRKSVSAAPDADPTSSAGGEVRRSSRQSKKGSILQPAAEPVVEDAPRDYDDTPSFVPPGAAPEYMTGWDHRCLSEHVKLVAPGTKVIHRDRVAISENTSTLFGVVFGNARLKETPDGYWYEVVLDSIRPGPEDGLGIGVTNTNPANLKKNDLELALDAPKTWIAGYEGIFFNSTLPEEEAEKAIAWQPVQLEMGAKIGISISKKGDFRLIVNGKCVLTERGIVRVDKPLFAIVDLIGRSGGVSFLPGSEPPATGKVLTAWDSELLSKQVVLMQSKRQASHKDKTGQIQQGVVFTNGVLPSFPEGDYFEVKIEAVRDGHELGMVIGIVSEKPQKGWKVPEIMDESYTVGDIWCAGYDGQAVAPRDDGYGTVAVTKDAISWYPTYLTPGMKVGLLLTAIRDGYTRELWILEEGAQHSKIAGDMPDGPFFGFVDLIGHTASVTLLPEAQPPEGIEPTEGIFGFGGYFGM